MSHQIVAFITREFTNNIKQPTRSQELKSTDPMFMLSIFHGMQTSERMHPKRVVMVKRVSSVGGVMKGTRGGNSNKCPRHIFYTNVSTARAFRRRIRRTIGRVNNYLVMFVPQNAPTGA